eukprot:12028989-Ditylum_brightwellii.AAC.1
MEVTTAMKVATPPPPMSMQRTAHHQHNIKLNTSSPSRDMSAGDNGSVIVWSVPPSKRGNNNGRHFWGSLSSSTSTESDLDCRVLNNPCDDVMDGEGSKWSCVMRNAKDHLSYVQGVAYDPLGVYVASQGSDRTVRIFSRKPCSLKKRGAGTNDTANTDVEE